MSKTKPAKKTISPIEKEPFLATKEVKAKSPVETVEVQRAWIPWLIAMAAIIILTMIAYYPAFDNDFVDWDDTTYVINNDLVRQKNRPTTVADVFKTPVSLNYHPIAILTMRWNDNSCPDCKQGISARPFIAWNVYLHILNSMLVFLLTFLLSKKNWFVAAFGAAVFALHPMHVESVAWVSERKDVLYVMFFLLGLLSYQRYLTQLIEEKTKANIRWLAATFVFFLLACLSKAMAVVFPLTLILMHFWNYPAEKPMEALQKSFAPKRILEYLPFFALAVFFGMMAMSVQSGGDFNGMLEIAEESLAVNKFDTFTLLQRFQFAAYGFCMYLYKFFYPTALCTLHPYPSQAHYDSTQIFNLALILFMLILATSLWSIRKTKIFAFGVGFYFISVALVLQFISVGTAIMADRYAYLPYVGIAFMLAVVIEKLPKQARYAFYGLAAVIAIAWLIQTRTQVDTWQDSEALWTHVIDNYPEAEQAYSIRGNFYGKQAEAAKDTASRNALMRKAEYDFRKAIEYKSTRADVFEGLGNIESMKGNTAEALELYSLAIKYNPRKATVYINRGVTLSIQGNFKAALEDMSKAVDLDPQSTHIMYRGIAKQSVGDVEGAKADFRQVLKMEPKNQAAAKRLQGLGG